MVQAQAEIMLIIIKKQQRQFSKSHTLCKEKFSLSILDNIKMLIMKDDDFFWNFKWPLQLC